MQAFFLNPAPDQRFCLLHLPPATQTLRGALVYIHPFAEELNRSRDMVARQARAFAQAGVAVLQIDLQGCGDSAGDFSQAGWDGWASDVRLARRWLAERLPGVPVGLWGLRAGCLLAAEVARQEAVPHLLFWQPVLSGQQHLTQFLRLQRAVDMLQGARAEGAVSPASRLASGQSVEVMGYTLSPALARGLAQATLADVGTTPFIHALEVSAQGAQVSAALVAQQGRWQAGGALVGTQAVAGPLFWQSLVPTPCPALMQASVQALNVTLQGGPE